MSDSRQARDQNRAPFLDSLIAARATQPLSFNMPGHKYRAGLLPAFDVLFGANVAAGDLNEAVPDVDYLHSYAAVGPLAEAQALLADAVGADHSTFLVNGSTAGNQAMLLAAAHDDQPVIVPRAAHRSVYAGLILSGARPVYVPPAYHPEVGFPLGVPVDSVAAQLAAHPDAAAIQLTSPNYYGYLSDTAALAALAHAHAIPLLVDEAHGAHLAFHAALPQPALEQGADCVVQSAHKTLGALTQAAWLHVRGGLIDRARLIQALALLQSSSPSVLLTASLDAARQQAVLHGEALLGRAVRLAGHARAEIRAIPGLWCYGDELTGAHGIAAHDPTKLVIRVHTAGWSGAAYAAELWRRFHVTVEFADPRHVICSVTMADDDAHIAQLLDCLRALAQTEPAGHVTSSVPVAPAALPKMVLTPRQAAARATKTVPLLQAAGETCAEQIIPYPPGVPLLMPGEMIDRDMIDHLRALLAAGIKLVGPQDAGLGTVLVVR